jgi:methylated-DNA-[protein]-cysteine S-methyltransferase
VQLPQARELETHRRLFRLYPEARELPPPLNTEIAIEGIVASLRGQDFDFSEVTLDMSGIAPFSRRVYEVVRAIRRGETLNHREIAATAGISGATNSVARAIAQNPFMIIVPCHRVVEAGGREDGLSPNAGVISRRRLLSIEGARAAYAKTLFDALLAAPSRPHEEMMMRFS